MELWKGLPMELVEQAKKFAIFHHGAKQHGHSSYETHLTAVAEMTARFRVRPVTIAAAYLHDVVEDTPVTVEDIKRQFGPEVADLVWRLTDAEGATRKERHLNTYWRIRESKDATLIKLSDRWHNHQKSIDIPSKFSYQYLSEYDYFKFALYNPNHWGELWELLDKQYEDLKGVTHLSYA